MCKVHVCVGIICVGPVYPMKLLTVGFIHFSLLLHLIKPMQKYPLWRSYLQANFSVKKTVCVLVNPILLIRAHFVLRIFSVSVSIAVSLLLSRANS